MKLSVVAAIAFHVLSKMGQEQQALMELAGIADGETFNR